MRQALEKALETEKACVNVLRRGWQFVPRGERILIEFGAYTAPPRHIVVKYFEETFIMARRYQVGEFMQQYIVNCPSGLFRELEV